MKLNANQIRRLVGLVAKHHIGSFEIELWEGSKDRRYPSERLITAAGSTLDQYPDGPWSATWLIDKDGNAVKIKEGS